jgi:YhcH/YjgK/YiaL family protein
MIFSRIDDIKRFIRGDFDDLLFFIRGLNSNAASGKYEVRGTDILAAVFEYETKPFLDAVLESHREYNDIQIVLSGREFGMAADSRMLEISEPYDSEKDIIFYRKPMAFMSHLRFVPGFFAVFFPEDAHITQIMASGKPEPVKKAVIKVRNKLL